MVTNCVHLMDKGPATTHRASDQGQAKERRVAMPIYQVKVILTGVRAEDPEVAETRVRLWLDQCRVPPATNTYVVAGDEPMNPEDV